MQYILIPIILFHFISIAFDVLYYKLGLRNLKKRVQNICRNNNRIFWSLEIMMYVILLIPINLLLFIFYKNEFIAFYAFPLIDLKYLLLVVLAFLILFSFYNVLNYKFPFKKPEHKFKRLRVINIYLISLTVNCLSYFINVSLIIKIIVWFILFAILFFLTNFGRSNIKEVASLTILNSLSILFIICINFSVIYIILLFILFSSLKIIYIKRFKINYKRGGNYD